MRSVQRARLILAAAERLIAAKGSDFTTHELVKEAGIAVQTFYKYFGSKDQVLLAVLEEMILAACQDLEQAAKDIADPLERLRSYVTGVILTSGAEGMSGPRARFVATEHWRLQQLYPDELAVVRRPFTDLIQGELRAAQEAGELSPTRIEFDAWLTSQLVASVFHHYAFATVQDPVEDIAAGLWDFVLGAWGGRIAKPSHDQPRAKRPRDPED